MFSRLFSFPIAQPDALGDQVKIVPPAEVRRWVEAGEAVVVDVREFREHAAERIPGALLNPLSSFDPARVPVPPEGKRLVLHCRSGARCGMASQRLLEAGFRGAIHRLQGGMIGWKSVGGPVVGEG